MNQRHSNQTEKFRKNFKNAEAILMNAWEKYKTLPPLSVRKDLSELTNISTSKIYNWFIRQQNYDGFNFGDWQKDEHERYEEAVNMYGHNWELI